MHLPLSLNIWMISLFLNHRHCTQTFLLGGNCFKKVNSPEWSHWAGGNGRRPSVSARRAASAQPAQGFDLFETSASTGLAGMPLARLRYDPFLGLVT